MKIEMKYTVFETSHGWIGCLSSGIGLRKATLPQTSPQLAIDALDNEVGQAAWSPGTFSGIVSFYKDYFNRQSPDFLYPLDFDGATLFQRKVWEITQSIPYGETRSYSWVANEIGKPDAVRAVGQALGKNPVPIIVPCHRVIASDGGLRGFGGGIEMKRTLLHLEGVITKPAVRLLIKQS
jgi:methylated-DNA-[protein]-cysteine S-methyltransferase